MGVGNKQGSAWGERRGEFAKKGGSMDVGGASFRGQREQNAQGEAREMNRD